METTVVAPISLTPSAVAEFKRILNGTETRNGDFLRIGVKGGGCSGLSYVLDFDAKKDNDELFDIEGIPVVMEQAHIMYLWGMQVDYQGGLNSRGFTFRNPNAASTCGCGTSFAV